MKTDVVVLGAGIVGISVAIHLQRRGRATVLVDRRAPGEETSFGNGGLIQREGVVPYGFPRELGALVRYAFNRELDARYHPWAILSVAPYLWRYWRNSAPQRHAQIARDYSRLIEHCVWEHDDIAAAAGATDLIQRRGWLRAFRTDAERDKRFAEAERWHAEFGINFARLDRAGLQKLEPDLAPVLSGAIHWTEPTSTNDPHALSLAYVRYFERLGGRVMQADALGLQAENGRWRLGNALAADEAVIALGPWSDLVTRRLGYRLPLGVKRGYHMHYRTANGAALRHVVLDAERGYALAPMRQGLRITTGAEFAPRDAPPTPVQVDRAEQCARELLPLTDRLDEPPWMGARPCTPDMLPVIGQAPRHRNLWFAFGHAHHGLTLGPVTGRLIADLVTGETPYIDPTPYRAQRF